MKPYEEDDFEDLIHLGNRKAKMKNENKPLSTKEFRELLGMVFNELPADDEEMIKEARDTYQHYKRIHENCLNKKDVISAYYILKNGNREREDWYKFEEKVGI